MPSFDIPMPKPELKALAGWDQQMNTYFLHIMDMAKDVDDEGYDVLWLGGRPDEVHDIDTIDGAVLAYSGKPLPTSVRIEMYRAANA